MEGFGFVPLEGDLVADQNAVAAAAAGRAAMAATTATTTASAGGAFDLLPSLQLPPAAPSAGTVSKRARRGCWVSRFWRDKGASCVRPADRIYEHKKKNRQNERTSPLSLSLSQKPLNLTITNTTNNNSSPPPSRPTSTAPPAPPRSWSTSSSPASATTSPSPPPRPSSGSEPTRRCTSSPLTTPSRARRLGSGW